MSAPRTQTPLHGGYDQSLLAAAPEASKAARQEGYNVDLLDERRPARTTATPPAGPPASRSKENYNTLTSPASPVDGGGLPRKVPFWRTRKGIIGLAVLAIVIVGAVVGGAVGGTVGNSKPKPNPGLTENSPSQGGTPSSTAGAVQGQTGNSTSNAPEASANPSTPAKSSTIASSSTPAGPTPDSNADGNKQVNQATSIAGPAAQNQAAH